MMLKRQLPYVLATFVFPVIPSVVAAAPQLAVQVGAFTTAEAADEQGEQVRAAGVTPVTIRKEETGSDKIFYKVLAGEFATRADADLAKKKLNEKGLEGFVRVNASLDLAEVTAAIESESKNYFSTGILVDASYKNDSLPPNFSNIRTVALSGPTTAPETLRAIADYIALLPDTNPGKAREINMLGHRTMSGKSAQRSYAPSEFEPARSLLLQVANGEIAVRNAEQAEARAIISHLLHYYDQNYYDALAAYRQVLQDQHAVGDLVSAANTNAEIAATCFELAKKSNYPMDRLVAEVSELWEQGNAFAKDSNINKSDELRSQVEFSNGKIGLMLTEAYLQAEDWQSANQMADSMIEINSQNEKSMGLVAETWCHKARAMAKMKRYEEAGEAAANAIKIAEKFGTVWGDELLDPHIKGYAWKYNIAQMQGDYEERDRVAAEIRRKFPEGHPGRAKYGLLSREGRK